MKYIHEEKGHKFMEFLLYSLVYFHLYKSQKVKKIHVECSVNTVTLRLISYHPLLCFSDIHSYRPIRMFLVIPWLTDNKAGSREKAGVCLHFSHLECGQEQQLQTQPQKWHSGALAEPNRYRKSKQSISQQLMVQFSRRKIHSSPNGVQVARDISLCTTEQL